MSHSFPCSWISIFNFPAGVLGQEAFLFGWRLQDLYSCIMCCWADHDRAKCLNVRLDWGALRMSWMIGRSMIARKGCFRLLIAISRGILCISSEHAMLFVSVLCKSKYWRSTADARSYWKQWLRIWFSTLRRSIYGQRSALSGGTSQLERCRPIHVREWANMSSR